jgi:tetratricopeptide (TPR) repeat protein
VGRGGPRRDWNAGPDRGYERRSGAERPRRESYGGDEDRRGGGFGERRGGGYQGDRPDRRSGGYRAGQTGRSETFRADRPRRPADYDRPGRGYSRNISERVGGAFPEDRPERRGGPSRGARPDRDQDRDRRADTRGYGERREFGGDRQRWEAGPERRGRTAGPSRYGTRPHTDRDRRPERAGERPESAAPRIPDSITEDQLSREAKAELRGLPADLATAVGRYLVAAELASDPELAYRYAQAARRLAARIGIVREVAGSTAYQTGRWAEALTELRAARRLTGRGEYLPLMADSERALGRLDRALELVHSGDAKRLPRAAQIELRIVESGIRRDQGLTDAAVLALQVPELTDGRLRPWSARLFYAYGDALLAAGRPEAAREAFSRAVVADEDEQTDALTRLDELDGITVEDLEEDDEDEDEASDWDDLEDESDEHLEDESDNDLEDEDESDEDLEDEEFEEDDEDGDFEGEGDSKKDLHDLEGEDFEDEDA